MEEAIFRTDPELAMKISVNFADDKRTGSAYAGSFQFDFLYLRCIVVV
jgi:hypothetical protein